MPKVEECKLYNSVLVLIGISFEVLEAVRALNSFLARKRAFGLRLGAFMVFRRQVILTELKYRINMELALVSLIEWELCGEEN